MQIMEIRRLALGASLEGLQHGGGPYVGYLSEPTEFYPKGYFPVGHADDHGTFYVIPKIAHAFNLPIDSAVDIFYYIVLGIAAIVSILGCAIYFRSWTARFVAAAWLTGFTWTTAQYADVYLIAPCCVMACVPWVLWVAQHSLRPWVFVGSGLMLGLVAVVANLMRAHTGTAILLFAIPSVAFAAQYSRRLRLIFFTFVIAGICGVNFYQSHLMRQADAFVRQHSPENISSRTSSHLFWHSIYIGLGFLRNTHGIEYKDSIASELAKRLSPEVEYMTREYDLVIRQQFFDLHGRDPKFVWQAWFAKLGVVLLMILQHAHIGLLAVWFSGMPKWALVSFIAALAISVLPGVLVMPLDSYLLGLWAWSAMFAVTSVGATLDRWKSGALVPARILQWQPVWTARLTRWGHPALRLAIIAVAVSTLTENVAGLRGEISTDLTESSNRLQQNRVKGLVSAGQIDATETKQLTLVDWRPSTREARLAMAGGAMKLTTDEAPFGYQLESIVPISGNGTVFVNYEIEVESGGVLIGILNEAGKWVETSQCVGTQIHKGRIGAHTPGCKHIRVVIANNRCDGGKSSKCRLANVTVSQYGDASTAKAENTDRATDAVLR